MLEFYLHEIDSILNTINGCICKIFAWYQKEAWTFLNVSGEIRTGRVKETYSKACETNKMEIFVKILNYFQPLTICPKTSILDVYRHSEYAFGLISFKDFYT